MKTNPLTGSITQNKGEIAVCPHCNQHADSFDCPIEDFTVPLTTGDRSLAVANCDNCGKQFTIIHNGDETYTSTP